MYMYMYNVYVHVHTLWPELLVKFLWMHLGLLKRQNLLRTELFTFSENFKNKQKFMYMYLHMYITIWYINLKTYNKVFETTSNNHKNPI